MRINKLTWFWGVICLGVVASCGNREDKAAQNLYAEAETQYSRGEYDAALQSINDIDSLYPQAFDVRKEAMHLKPQIIEKQALAMLSENDSLMAVTKYKLAETSSGLRRVSNSIEGYYESKSTPSDINTSAGVYARMSPDAVFYIVAVTPGAVANSLTVSAADSVASTHYIPADGERVMNVGGRYALTFLEGECDGFAAALASRAGSDAVVQFNGRSGKVGQVRLNATQTRAFAQVYECAQATRQIKLLEVKRQQIERTLTVARNQIARTMRDNAPDSVSTSQN